MPNVDSHTGSAVAVGDTDTTATCLGDTSQRSRSVFESIRREVALMQAEGAFDPDGPATDALAWRLVGALPEPCRHQHIVGIREVYMGGEFQGIDYDECDVSGQKAIREGRRL